MSTVRLVRLAALLTLALICGTAQAQSMSFRVSGSTRLQPAPGSDEPKASGTATFHGGVDLWLFGAGSGVYDAFFSGTLSVSCRGLTPLATYRINESAYFTADSNGRATLNVSPFFADGLGWFGLRRGSAYFDITVARQASESAAIYVDVLGGAINVSLP
jgi:hypothetical protein